MPAVLSSSDFFIRSLKKTFLLVIKDSLAIPPSMVCIGFFCLPSNPSKASLVPGLRAPADIKADPLSVVTSFNTVLFTKKLGTSKIASDGLSILIPLGSLAVFKTLATAASACRSVISSPASRALAIKDFLADSIASSAGLYLKKGRILLSWNTS